MCKRLSDSYVKRDGGKRYEVVCVCQCVHVNEHVRERERERERERVSERERELKAHFLATDPPQRPQVCRFDAEMTLMAADNEKKSFRNKKIMGSAENRRKRRRRQICRPSDENPKPAQRQNILFINAAKLAWSCKTCKSRKALKHLCDGYTTQERRGIPYLEERRGQNRSAHHGIRTLDCASAVSCRFPDLW